MKKIFFILFFILSCVGSIFSQDYKTGIGLRGGWTSGITAKHFIKEGKAIEGILSSGYMYRGWQITGLYEIHKPAFAKDDVEGLFWLYGGGAHFGGGYRYDHNYVSIGVDLIFGIEYKIPDIPFTVGADVKPFFDFITDRDRPGMVSGMALFPFVMYFSQKNSVLLFSLLLHPWHTGIS